MDKSSVLENITDTEHIKVPFKDAEISSEETQGSRADKQVSNAAIHMYIDICNKMKKEDYVTGNFVSL